MEIENLKLQKEIDNLKIDKIFSNIQEMQADSNLSVGMCVQTMYYYNEDDMGGSKYIIEEHTNQTIDNGEFILLENGEVAHLIRPKKLYVSMFGARGNSKIDDLQAIQNAINYMQYGDELNLVPNKAYYVSDTIHFKRGLNFNGNQATLFPFGAFASGSFIFSIDEEVNGAIDNFSTIQSYIKNISIQYYGNTISQVNGIYIGYDTTIENAYFWKIEKCIAVKHGYIDFVKIKDISIWQHEGSEYAIDTGFQGDGRIVDTVHSHLGNNGNILYVGDGHNGIEVSRIVNGKIHVGGAIAYIHNCHLEGGNIETTAKTKLTLQDCMIWKNPNIVPLDFSQCSYAKVSNIKICYNSLQDFSEDSAPDINFPPEKYNIIIENCYKIMMANSDISFQHLAGIESNLQAFNNNKTILSSKSDIIDGFPFPYFSMNRKGSYNLIGSIYQDGNFNWKLDAGTYYYYGILLFDKTRMIGSNAYSVEINKAITNEALMMGINGRTFSNIRLYRGTASTEYSNYVDTSNINGYLIEDGLLCNGDRWQERDVGNYDTFLSATDYYNNGVNVIIHASTIPTVGQWQKGDRIINNGVGENQPYGWICTQAGTPGQWKVISTIS